MARQTLIKPASDFGEDVKAALDGNVEAANANFEELYGGAGSVGPTIVVAASNSTDLSLADYVCDGTDDDVTINAALAALPATGGEVLLLEGLYTVSDTIHVPSYCWLHGNGYGTHIQLKAGQTTAINLVENADTTSGNTHIRISGLRIDGNSGTMGEGALGQQKGISLVRASHFIVEGNWIENLGNLATASCEAIRPRTCSYGVIRGNVISNTVDGINTSNDGSTYSKYLTITGNVITSTCRDYPLNIAGCTDCVWANNVCTEAYKEGINVTTAARNVIANNVVSACGRLANNTYYGIKLGTAAEANLVIGNHVRSGSSGNALKYGIGQYYANAGNRIVLNDVAGAGATADLYTAGTQQGQWFGNHYTTASGTFPSYGDRPASSESNGTDAPDLYLATAVAGGATSGTTGQKGGRGGDVVLTAGPGGNAESGSTNGDGGDIVLTPGAAGTGGGSAGVVGHVLLSTASVPDCADDSAAASAGVPVGGIYRTGSALKIRMT